MKTTSHALRLLTDILDLDATIVVVGAGFFLGVMIICKSSPEAFKKGVWY